jgi:hypothetical protein
LEVKRNTAHKPKLRVRGRPGLRVSTRTVV